MKRTLCFIITVLLLFTTVPLSINAISSDTISEEEALSLIKDARAFYHTAVRGFGVAIDYDVNSEYILRVNDGFDRPYEWTYRLFDESTLPGGSYEGMKDYSKTIFHENIDTSIYEYETRFVYISGNEVRYYIPRFYLHADGKLYTTLEVSEFDYAVFSNFTMKADPLYEYDWLVKFVNGDSKNATYYVRGCIGAEGMNYLAWVPVKFVNTESGWRIDKCAYTDILTDYTAMDVWGKDLIPYDESPSTGDTAAERVTVIGAVSLACIIPAACLTIKRRRRVAVD